VLVDVLREWAGFLEVLVIDWEDDFGGREAGYWELKKSVLESFEGLGGVGTWVGRTVVDEWQGGDGEVAREGFREAWMAWKCLREWRSR
jgi:hypothetical protein